MRSLFKRLWRDERGATPLEYSILAMCVTLVLVTGLYGKGESLAAVFEDVSEVTEAARQGAGTIDTSCSGGIRIGDLRPAPDRERG